MSCMDTTRTRGVDGEVSNFFGNEVEDGLMFMNSTSFRINM